MRKIILDNKVNVEIINTEKFKTDYISVRFILPLEKEKASSRSLLAMMMSNRCAKYPTNKEMTNYLDMNYGINLSMNTYSLGGAHLIEVRTSGINDDYIDNDSFRKQFDLIEEVLFNPLFDENGLFDVDLFEEAKMILKSKVVRRNDDPQTYAMDQACKLFGNESKFSISVLGNEESIDALTRECVKEAYYDLLNNARVDVVVVSSKKEEEIIDIVSKYKFAHQTNAKAEIYYDYQIKTANKEENRQIDQCSLILGWYSGIKPNNPLFYAFKLASIIIGGDSNSFMFKKIREEKSLCYSVYTSIFSIDAFMIAYAGISYENKELVSNMMKEIVADVCNGKFDEELETAKLLYKNSLLTQYDSPTGMLNFEYQQELFDIHRSLDEVISLIDNVSKDDVLEALSKLEFIGEYTLKEVSDDE